MKTTFVIGCALTALTLLLSACGGDGGSSKSTTTVGAAGGTVNGPDGLTVTIPAGALDSNVEIGIKRAGSDAPALPSDINSTTQAYEFTPHGIQFNLPVTISVPSSIDPNVDPVMMAEQGDEGWSTVNATQSAGRVSWQVMGFSWGALGDHGVCQSSDPNDPYACRFAGGWPIVTAQPAAAMTTQLYCPYCYLLSEEADVTLTIHYNLPRDCTSNPTVKVVHWSPDELVAGQHPRTTVYDAPAALTTVSNDGNYISGDATIPVIQFRYPDKRHYFDVGVICHRTYNNQVRGFSGSVTFDARQISAPAAPGVTQQPADQTVTAPATATFAATSDKVSATVQWQVSTDGGNTWTDIPGATSASYTTAATTTADSGTQFRAVFTNTTGSTATNAATLTVNPTPAYPVIVTHPTSQSVAVGATATFSVVVTGTPTPTLQWQVSTDGTLTWTDIPGATGTSYTTPATTAGDNGKEYRVIATNGSGNAGSASATLTVTSSLATMPYGKISALNAHTCAITGGGAVYCWGNGASGELGYGTAQYSATPVQATGLSNAVFVSAGGDSTCAIENGGQLSCWGAMNDSLSPTSMGVSNAAWVAVGMTHACYVNTSGEIWCWGTNNYGQLGDGTQSARSNPVQVKWANGTAVTSAVSVAAGQSFTCARMTGGEVYCWGINAALGARTSPERVVRLLPSSQTMDFTTDIPIAAGMNHACAIENSSGQTLCWGNNSNGQLGDNTTTARDTAVAVGRFGNGKIAAGVTHSCSIDSAVGSSLLCWGNGYFGNGSGLQSVIDAGSAVRVGTYYNNSTVVTAVATGDRYTCALLATSGDVQCWGLGSAGQIGNNDTLDVLSPTSTSAGTVFWTP